MKKMFSKFIELALFVSVGTFARILPHPANFAPITAMALFGGVYLNKKKALTLPVAAMVLSDIVLGFDSLGMRLTVYGSFLAVVGIGFYIKRHKNLKNIVLASVASSILFFLTTNYAVWALGSLYPKSLIGLVECYTLAIPFFRNTILGDLTYTGVFFGGYEFLINYLKTLKSNGNWKIINGRL